MCDTALRRIRIIAEHERRLQIAGIRFLVCRSSVIMSSRGEVLPSFLPASGIEFLNFYITSTFGKQLYCTDKSFSLYVGITSTSYSFKGNSTSTIKIGRAKTTFISKQLLCHLNFWKTAYTVSFIVQRSPSLCMLALLQPHNLL